MTSGLRASLVASCCLLGMGALPVQAPAQLDETCTVSVLNQTARVRADGTWRIPNVPANMGPVRARVTCLKEGDVLSGSSDFFSIVANRMSGIPQIPLGASARTPISLALEGPVTRLTVPGQTVQLRAWVRFADGATADVAGEAAGTLYASTNPGIASVSPEGLVTAHSSGRVLVSALHEAIVATIEMTVQVSGDADGDGLPDDWEMANGLDPNDPADAVEDPDGDGLPTVDEFLAGLLPFQPDSDGDGLSDGLEVNGLRTNPLLTDTDGDGLRDGLEVATQSDPRDPDSFNLAAALESLSVAPGAFDLFFNTVFGEASYQLRVTGRLIDGQSLDLTRRRYGVAYGSSDLTVASFGSEEGRVYAGSEGQADITVSVGGRSAQARVRVRTYSPTALSYLPLSGYANGLALSGDYAYVATGATGLQVIDVSDPLRPALVGRLDTPGNANDVRVVGNRAYVADGAAGLAIVDISQPEAPRLAGSALLIGTALDLAVSGNLVYVADGLGLTVVDVTNPTAPFPIGFVETPAAARGVDVVDNLAVVAVSEAGLVVVDVTDPTSPAIVGSVETSSGEVSNAADVTLSDGLAYVADGAEARLGGLRIIDLRNPVNPVVLGETGDAFGLTSAALERGLVLASDYYYINAVPIFSATPDALGLRGVIDFSRAPSFRDDEGHGVAVRDGFVYMVGVKQGLRDSGATGDSALHVGRYAILDGVDPDGLSPFVQLTAPQSGSLVKEGQSFRLKADARDDFRVESVTFTVNGQPLSTDFTPPFESAWFDIPRGSASQLTFGAVATDFGGRQGVAEAIVVNVAPNPEPSVRIVSPPPGQTVPAGRRLLIAAEASDDGQVSRVEIWINGVRQYVSSAPPYRFNYVVPGQVSQLSITAVAFDSAGPSPQAGPLLVAVASDQPPSATILTPRDGELVVAGSPVEMIAGAWDDVGVRQVDLYVDNVRVVSLGGPAYQWTLTAPPVGQTRRLRLVAHDAALHETSSSEVTITSVADPGTSVRGWVIDERGAPLAEARVETDTVSTFSNPDGSFRLSDVPTRQGGLSLSAFSVVAGVEVQGGLEELLQPIPGGVIEVGDLILRPFLPSAILRGRVIDESGSLVPGALVKVYDQIVLFTATSGPDGSFLVPGIHPQGSLTVSITVQSGGELLRSVTSAEVVGGGETDLGDLVVSPVETLPDPLTTVTGSVVDRIGEPVAAARVNIFTPVDVFQTVTAANGTFSLSGIPTVDGDLYATAWTSLSGRLALGETDAYSPNPGSTTELGTIHLGNGSERISISSSLPVFLEEPVSACPAELPRLGPVPACASLLSSAFWFEPAQGGQ